MQAHLYQFPVLDPPAEQGKASPAFVLGRRQQFQIDLLEALVKIAFIGGAQLAANPSAGLIQGWRRFLDPGWFTKGVDHVCTVRIALYRLALLMEARGGGAMDAATLRRLNEEVALGMGETLP